MENQVTFVGGASLDYLSLASWRNSDYRLLQSVVFKITGQSVMTGKPWKVMQYDGWKGEGWFVGMGQQKGEAHYFAQFSGGLAHKIAMELRRWGVAGSGLSATRIDLQVTVPVKSPLPLPEMGRDLRALGHTGWGRGGRAPKVNIHDNSDGYHTVYIGSRRSRRMYRIYNKDIDGVLHARFEVEYKREASEGLWWSWLSQGEKYLAGVLHNEYMALPAVSRETLSCFKERFNTKPEELLLNVKAASLEGVWNWYETQVFPSMARFLGTSEGERLREALFDIVGVTLYNQDSSAA